ncbi:leucyl/phenylalanyl-tRNA--protein transferase [Thiohalobacter sp. IOR34]|uniref:leucyl/phenylalanyl-tRNA--protein transferase n=1 Tax=Thiohalobacter sp. IOR34 TaxID=3057176 RepID=UPI0025B1B4BD|nr:leucyl/phenylalanyl-tRNA--protein transferase [Thiohalobacter sp. IOR34]WJW74384.1 leucyl/phenylalanyl-tRNA--protein transferase [Thiohalobacter sp. IOR34]
MHPNRTAPYWIDPAAPGTGFPPVEAALREPDGLLALGGDLSPSRLLDAYRRGIFPWYEADQPILWWSPDPRMVLFPERLRVSRSLRKSLRNKGFEVTLDRDFAAVIHACAEPRAYERGTWLSPAMRHAYLQLFRLGHAHSAEAWLDGELVGGLYGVAIGRVFYGESMFSRVRDASKVAFVRLVRQLQAWGFGLIDCQVHTDHLASLGAAPIPRAEFIHLLQQLCPAPAPAASPWRLELPGSDVA